MKLLNNHSSCLGLKLNFSLKIDKLLFCFSVCSIAVFRLWLLSLNFSVRNHLKCCTSHELNPVTECAIFWEKTSTWLAVTKTKKPQSEIRQPCQIAFSGVRQGSEYTSAFGRSQSFAKGFKKNEVVCLILAFIDNVFVCQLPNHPMPSIWR